MHHFGHMAAARQVLHVVASTDRRGAETAAVSLSKVLGGEVVALAPGFSGSLEVPVLGPSRFSPLGHASLRQRARRAGVVVAHGSSTLPAVAISTAGTGVPWVYRSIGDPLAWCTTRARRARVRLAVLPAQAVVALWRGAAATWHERLGVPAEKVFVIPNCADPERFHPPTGAERIAAREALKLPADASVAMYMGALSAEKRVDVAIRAVAGIAGLTLAIIGEGPERPQLEALAVAVGDGRVHFRGATGRPEAALAAADVVVVSSDTEGMPAVAIEAGMAGVPVAGTRVGAVPEIVLDGRSGVLVAPGDPVRLGTAITTCLERRAEMGAAARGHCSKRFDVTLVAERWREILTPAEQVRNNCDKTPSARG